MCTRYFVELSPELRPIIEAARRTSLADRMRGDLARPVAKEGEIRPTDIAAVIASNRKGLQSVFPMVWGFSQSDINHTRRSQPLVNCRIETAGEKQLWAESWSRRRCIIPASYYFEWEHFARPDGSRKTGDKYAIQPAGATVTWLAGLYRIEDGYPHFAILTREPGAGIRFIHDRMPVILDRPALADWINPMSSPDAVRAIAASALTDMVYEKAQT